MLISAAFFDPNRAATTTLINIAFRQINEKIPKTVPSHPNQA